MDQRHYSWLKYDAGFKYMTAPIKVAVVFRIKYPRYVELWQLEHSDESNIIDCFLLIQLLKNKSSGWSESAKLYRQLIYSFI